MVSFNCEACNDVIKKPKLDAHKGRCHGAVFSCIDCSTTFEGTSYRTHTSCISEEQKYQGALYKPDKGKGKKGNPVAAAELAKPAAVAEEPKEETKPAEQEPKKDKKDKKKKEKAPKLSVEKAEESKANGVEKSPEESKPETSAEAESKPTDKQDKKKKKEKKDKSKSKDDKPVPVPVEEKTNGAEVPEVDMKDAEPKEDKKSKDKKRKRDTEAAATTNGAETKKPKKEKNRAAIVAAEDILAQIKIGRPLTLQKAMKRSEKEAGEDKVDMEEIFSMLRLKKEKDGSVSVFVVAE